MALPTDEEWTFFEETREGFEMLYSGQWVLIKGRTLVGVYDRQDDVFKGAALRFAGAGCLIRRVGDEVNRGGKPGRREALD